MATSLQTRIKMNEKIKRFEEFKLGNIRAERVEGVDYLSGVGRLPSFLADQLIARFDDGTVYIVYSYQTPIGWANGYDPGTWFIPEVTYSVSTTHHQNLLVVITETDIYEKANWQHS